MYYYYPEPFKVGVDTSRFDKVYAKQANSMWCWAACLEMIMRHNGFNISQEEFAKHSCGVNWLGIPNNCPASFNVITNYLNSLFFDDTDEYILSASLNFGMPDLLRVYKELILDNPVIVAYRNYNSSIAHAVLITGMEGYFLHNSIFVTKFIIRDPWPRLESYFTRGRIEKNNAREFTNSISAHWFPSFTVLQANEPIWMF